MIDVQLQIAFYRPSYEFLSKTEELCTGRGELQGLNMGSFALLRIPSPSFWVRRVSLLSAVITVQDLVDDGEPTSPVRDSQAPSTGGFASKLAVPQKGNLQPIIQNAGLGTPGGVQVCRRLS